MSEDIKNLKEGIRYDEGKLRYDLVNPDAHRRMVEILTYGANKYSDRNWEKGMAWSKVIASLKRHLADIEAGKDFDEETRKLNIDHLQCNAHFLSTYYSTYPQGDDRPHKYLNKPKIGLDIDEVLADWVGHWCKYHNISKRPEFWNFDKDIEEKFELLKEDKTFWLGIPRKFHPRLLKFEPTCYITTRNIPKEWTEEWLQINEFPLVPVYTVEKNSSKIEAAKKANIDIFVDDCYQNFVDLNKAGICCFLFDAPHNQRYDVGFKRIKSLEYF